MSKQVGQYLLLEDSVLGQGSDGTVYLGKCKETNNLVAIKKIDKEALSERAKNHLSVEIGVLKSMQHPNVIKLLDVIDDPSMSAIHLVLVKRPFM